MKKIIITIIGAGSSYTPELIEGLILRHEELPIGELRLVDIDEHNGKQKMEIIYDLTLRMLKKYNLDWIVSKTLDRRSAIKGADFVLTQIRVGALQARVKDERIPLSHGMLGQETNGPGGLFKLLRTLPVMIEIANDIAELAPKAWMINFTNPSGMVTEGLLKYAKHKKVLGLCNVPIGMLGAISKNLEIPEEELFVKMGGLNHFVFGLEVVHNGINKMEELLGKFSNESYLTMNNIAEYNYEPHFVKNLGILLCGYHNYYFNKQSALNKEIAAYEKNKTRAEEVVRLEKSLFEKYKDPTLNIKPIELSYRGGARYSEVACELVNQIYNNKGTYQVVNTINNGTIVDLPYDSAIEATSIIDKDGAHPLNIGHLPIQVRGITMAMKSFEIVAVDAAIEKDIEKAFLALAINPLTSNLEVARKVFDELCEAHKEYLPWNRN